MPPELSKTPSVFEVKARMAGKRIDAYLASRYPDYSRSVIQKVIDAEAVLIDGKAVKASYRVREGDEISVRLPELASDEILPEDIPLSILYEDEWLTVVDKPPGLVTHPAKGHWSGTLVNALQFHFDTLSTVSGEQRPGVVHRLDRDTSGLMIVAKDDSAHRLLARQFEQRTIQKEYLAIVQGEIERDSDYIEKFIGPHPTHREKTAIRRAEDGGKPASTFYETIERFRGFSLVRCLPRTGRTHQIRVHMLHIGYPIVADKLYSGRDRLTLADVSGRRADAEITLIDRQALHARRIRFEHPVTNAPLDFTSPVPDDMNRVIAALRDRAQNNQPTGNDVRSRLLS